MRHLQLRDRVRAIAAVEYSGLSVGPGTPGVVVRLLGGPNASIDREGPVLVGVVWEGDPKEMARTVGPEFVELIVALP